MKALRLLLILCVPVTLAAQGIQLVPFASGGQIKAAVYSDAAHGSLFPGLDPTLKRFGVVITNTTDQPVIAHQIRWDWIDAASGQPRATGDTKDTTGVTPIAGANSTYLVIPGYAPIYPGAKMVSQGLRVTPGVANAQNVTVTVDTIIMGDGQVIGPDKGNLQASLQARAQAVTMLRLIINAAHAGGRDPVPDVQKAMANAPPMVKVHLGLLTGKGKSAPMPPNYPLPNFYRK